MKPNTYIVISIKPQARFPLFLFLISRGAVEIENGNQVELIPTSSTLNTYYLSKVILQ